MKILFVDDSKTMLKINASNVKKVIGDFEVFKASNGAEALAAVKEHTPDLIVLDLVLPDMTGLDILEQLNKLGFNKMAGFISSMKTNENYQKAMALGAKFFLDKPATPEAITKAFRDIGVLK